MNISSHTEYEVISRQISGSCAEVRWDENFSQFSRTMWKTFPFARSGVACLQNSSEPLIRVSIHCMASRHLARHLGVLCFFAMLGEIDYASKFETILIRFH